MEDWYVSRGHGSGGDAGIERERQGRKRESRREGTREGRDEGSFEGARASERARSLLRFMRPLPSPLAQLSSRYNIVVYSEPRLRSVNHPSVPHRALPLILSPRVRYSTTTRATPPLP